MAKEDTMHELSLIQELIGMVAANARENGITRVERVRLVVGECHGALPDALSFAFEVLVPGTSCDGAVLEIEEVPASFRCRACGEEFGGGLWALRCPRCSTGGALLLRGRELYIDYYEGDAVGEQDGENDGETPSDGRGCD